MDALQQMQVTAGRGEGRHENPKMNSIQLNNSNPKYNFNFKTITVLKFIDRLVHTKNEVVVNSTLLNIRTDPAVQEDC